MRKGADFIGMTYVFYCHDGRDNYLLHKRSKNCRDEAGNWDCGGGGLEHGESFEDAVRREVLEEYGAKISDLKFGGVSNVLRENQGTKTHWVVLVFSAHIDPSQVKLNDPEKMETIGWFQPAKWPSPLHSQFLRHFELIKNL